MSPEVTALLYCLLIAGASLAGGLVPLWFRLSHTTMQLALSFVAGVMLGVGLLHLLPHAFFELHDIDRAMWWALVGFLLVFFLERVFHFHHHDAPDDDPAVVHQIGLSHAHEPHVHGDACQHEGHSASVHQFSWGGAIIGLTLHSLIDGIALGAGVAAESHGAEASTVAGLGIFLAIALHKPFDSLAISTLMAAGGWSARARKWVNALYAAVATLGVALFFFGFYRLDGGQHEVLGCALAFAAGAFLCIATSDLLPELQFHSHDRLKLSCALLLGIALAWGIVFAEGSSHSHSPSGHGTVDAAKP